MYRNVKSEPYFETPLAETLGDDYEAVAAQSQPARRRRRNLVGVPPHELIRRRYVEKADTVRYGPHPRVNFADIWRRRDLPRDGKAPVLLQVPGGAWMIGMRRPQSYPLLSHLAERGWVCVSIDYRVSPVHTWPDHIVDVKRALAWIKEHIAEYGGDPDFVAITGGSAGGHLCASGRVDARRSAVPARVRGRRHLGGGGGADLRPLRLVLHRGPRPQGVRLDCCRGSWSRRASPSTGRSTSMRRRSPGCGPTPRRSSSCTERTTPSSRCPRGASSRPRMRDVSKSTVTYAEIPHAQHAFDFFGSPRGHYTAQAVEKFLSWVHATRDEK